jgi:hypothetical protein
VKSVLKARLDDKQITEASDTTVEPESKENKELEAKLADLIKQTKELSGKAEGSAKAVQEISRMPKVIYIKKR